MAGDALAQALVGLEKAREEAAREVALATAKLHRIDGALHQLRSQISPGDLPKRQDFAGLGIVEATKRFLTEVRRPRSTADIANELRSRGVTTKSKNFVPTVYATLMNSKAFTRTTDGNWALKPEKK